RQHWTKNLFLEDPRFRIHVGNNRWSDEISISRRSRTACNHAAFLLSYVDVIQDRFPGALVDHRAHVVTGLIRRTDRQARYLNLQLLQKLIVNRLSDDGARTGRAFLPLISEC